MPKESDQEGFTVVDKRGRRDEPAAEPAPPRSSSPRVERSAPEPASAFETSEPDLTALFLMLASSALVHLGAAPDPMTGAPQRDLAQARFTIDLLRLLRDKTEGHRTPEESQLLEEILYNLQIQFVGAMERPSQSG